MRLHSTMQINIIIIILTSLSTLLPGNDGKRHKGENRRQRKEPVLVDPGMCELEVTCKGDPKNLPVHLPIQGPVGPPGIQGEKGDRGQRGPEGDPGMPADWKIKIFRILGLPTPTPSKVAFFTGLSDNLGATSNDEDVAYDNVLTNVGGGYDVTTGYFTAPVNGTYYFNIVTAAQGRQKAAVMLIKNGSMIITVWAESIPFWASATGNAVLQLQKGDKVWLTRLKRAPWLHGYMYSTFAGFLLFED